VLVERELVDRELALELAQLVIGPVEAGVVDVVRDRHVRMERKLRLIHLESTAHALASISV